MKWGLLVLVAIFVMDTLAVPATTKRRLNEDDLEKIQIQVQELGKKCWSNREKNPDTALVYGLKALELANNFELDKEAAQLNNYVGVIYMHYMYKFRKAIPYFQQALHLSRTINDSLQLAYAYNNLGDVFLNTGNIPLAEQYGQESLDISEAINNERCVSYAYINLASVYRSKGEYNKSLAFFEKAMNLRKNQEETARMGFVMFDYAKTLKEAGDLDGAMKYYSESLSFSMDYEDYRYVSWCLNGIAGIHYIRKEYDKALEYYGRALEWNVKQDHTYGKIENNIGLALIYAQLGEKKKGEDLLHEAKEMAQSLGLNSQNIKLYNGLIEFYKIIGDYENATRVFDAYLIYFDSSYSSQQLEIVTEMDRGYNVEQSLLRSEQALKINKVLRERLILVLSIISFALIFVVRLYYLNRKKNNQLKALNKTKDKLLSVISHDMKNSFSSILGFGELTREAIEDREYEDADKYALFLEKSTGDAYGLLTRLLEWSNTHNGSLHFNPKMSDLNEVFENQEKIHSKNAERNNISLVFNNRISNEISIDPSLLSIIINNLLHNAIKYTKEGGQVKLSSEPGDNAFSIVVEDNGVGMSPEMLSKLNGKYTSLKSSKGVRNEKGTGLGLSIVKELVQLHQGEMFVYSKLDEGTKIILKFTIGQLQKK
jgi:signal transduction histidine kinase